MEKNYSVLMSVYYKENPQWLDLSIKSMLEQSIRTNEFIIIKDGPLNQKLDSVIEKYTNRYPDLFKIIVNETNLGLGPALAKGIKASTNELIARMDSDDYSVENRCEKQLLVFSENPNLDIVGSYEKEFLGDIDDVVSIHKVPEYNDDIKKFMRRRCAILHPTVMYKKSSVIKCGNYRSVRLYEDYDLFARMIFDYNVKCYNMPESLYYIRVSEDFFDRRGGLKYAITALKFKWKLFRKRHMSILDFCVSGIGQLLICILPNGMRKQFYMKALRNK